MAKLSVIVPFYDETAYLRSALNSIRAQRIDERVMDDLDDLLAGRDGFQDFMAHGARAHFLHESAGDGQRHIGFEQRPAHFAQRLIDILFRQRAAPGQFVEDAGKPVLKILEHALR